MCYFQANEYSKDGEEGKARVALISARALIIVGVLLGCALMGVVIALRVMASNNSAGQG